jgi:hypothetical protein
VGLTPSFANRDTSGTLERPLLSTSIQWGFRKNFAFSEDRASTLQKFLQDAAHQEGVSLRRFNLLASLLMDHVPFSDAGYPAVDFSVVARAIGHVHTRRDSPDLIEEEGLDEVGRVILGAISLIEEAATVTSSADGR